MIVIYHFEAKNSQSFLDPTQLLENAPIALRNLNLFVSRYAVERINLNRDILPRWSKFELLVVVLLFMIKYCFYLNINVSESLLQILCIGNETLLTHLFFTHSHSFQNEIDLKCDFSIQIFVQKKIFILIFVAKYVC